METLKECGVESTDLLIAATGSDEVNLLCAMTAKGINPSIHTIARIRNPEYIKQLYAMRNVFGLSMTFNPEKQAAMEIERLLKLPGFFGRESFVKGKVEIVELRIDAESKLKDVTLSTMYKTVGCRVLVCAVIRDGETVTPSGSCTLREGDKIFVTAPTDNLALLMKNLGIVTHKVKNVVIAGGGTVSYYLAQALENHMDVTIIEKDAERCKKLSETLDKTNVICGDVSSQALLGSERISECDALVTLTGIDEQNIITSLYASKCKVPTVVTKLDIMDDSVIISNMPLGRIICPRKLCCNNVVRYVRAIGNQVGAAVTIHSIADGHAEALEFVVDETTKNCGVPLKNLKLKENVLLVCITRRGVIEIPGGDSFFNVGDSIVVVSSREEVILRLNDIFA
jgi:trk system potassium uptake protein TrkA